MSSDLELVTAEENRTNSLFAIQCGVESYKILKIIIFYLVYELKRE